MRSAGRTHRLLSAVIFVFALASASFAHADTIQVFNVANATFASGATGSGTISVNETTGTYAGLNFTYRLGASTAVFTTISGQSQFSTQYYFYSYDSAGDLLDLGVPGANLIGYTGGFICSPTHDCGSGYGYVILGGGTADIQNTGSLVAAAPEPSSLIFLATGLLGTLTAAKRRVPRP